MLFCGDYLQRCDFIALSTSATKFTVCAIELETSSCELGTFKFTKQFSVQLQHTVTKENLIAVAQWKSYKGTVIGHLTWNAIVSCFCSPNTFPSFRHK